MSTVQITGVLKHPMNGAVNKAVIRVIARDSVGSILSLEGKEVTSALGIYDFRLVYGTHSLEIKFSDQYHMVADVTIDASTPVVMDLQTLLAT